MNRSKCITTDTGTVNIPNNFGSNFSQNQDGFTYYGFDKCLDQRCKIKCFQNNYILPLNNCKSHVNGRNYVLLSDENLNCTSSNIIYLISCAVCGVQYVGETGRAAGVRWAEHLAKIRKGDRSQIIYSHFDSDDAHRSVPLERRLRFQIIEKVHTDDLPSLEPGIIRKRRTDRELFWISALRTVAPLGLNDNIEGFGMRGNAYDSAACGFNMYRIVNICTTPRARHRRGRHRKKARGNLDDSQFCEFKTDLLRLNRDCAVRIENFILSKSRLFLERFVRSSHFGELSRGLRYLVSSCVGFFRKVKPSRKLRPEIPLHVDFTHQIFNDVNINSIIESTAVKSLLPRNLTDKFSIKLVFKYNKTIGSKILNYNEVLKSVGNVSFNDISQMSCDCHSSPFQNSSFEHVITGDMNIIEDEKLRELCSYGTKFRENPLLNIGGIKKAVSKSFDSLRTRVARKLSISFSCLRKWRNKFVYVFSSKLMACSVKQTYRLPVLSNVNSKNELARLKDKYVITVVDKASNNFAFTCKIFHYLKLATELGMDNISPGNDTYVHSSSSENELVSDIKQDLSKFRIVPAVSESKLALLYHIPKFHKSPPKMRYIAGNVSTVTSQLDKLVALILKMCKNHFINLCQKSEAFSGVKYVFDVQTSMEVKGMFDQARDAQFISINDFSTLYTLFDHKHLLGNMKWLLLKLSKNSNLRHIKLNYSKAWWVLGNAEGIVFSLEEVLEMIEYLVKNSYIKAIGNIFRQAKGIIMGGKSSGWLSDCSLMVDEYKYVEAKIKGGFMEEANKLKFFRRYRDDCTSLNIDNFLTIASEIYPPSLSLTQENDSPIKVNVLDMVAEIKEERILTKVFCKTDHFPFSVISYPFLESNLDTRICYNVFFGQIIRIQRLTSLKEDFEVRVKFLADILVERGYNGHLLRKKFCQAIDKYGLEFQKWSFPQDIRLWFGQIMGSN